MNRDASAFKDYWEISGNNDKIEYHYNLDFKLQTGEIVIVDEADFLMLRKPFQFKDALSKAPTICFTSTLPDQNPGALE